jgi:ribonuclease E
MAAGEGEEDAESEQDGEEGDEQAARGEQQGSGERRRRRGRRGGRRRRGGSEEGLAGSISDELAAGAPSEASDAVADFDGNGGEAAPSIAQAEHAAEPQVTQHDAQPDYRTEVPPPTPVAPEPAPVAAVVEEEPADDKSARRRSTVREKVSFLSSSASEPATPVAAAPEPVAPPAPAPEPAPEAAAETPAAPRRAGWWSRRFGGGE